MVVNTVWIPWLKVTITATRKMIFAPRIWTVIPRLAYLSNQQMATVSYSAVLMFIYQNIWCHIPKRIMSMVTAMKTTSYTELYWTNQFLYSFWMAADDMPVPLQLLNGCRWYARMDKWIGGMQVKNKISKKKQYHYIVILKKDLYLTMQLCAHYNTLSYKTSITFTLFTIT